MTRLHIISITLLGKKTNIVGSMYCLAVDSEDAERQTKEQAETTYPGMTVNSITVEVVPDEIVLSAAAQIRGLN